MMNKNIRVQLCAWWREYLRKLGWKRRDLEIPVKKFSVYMEDLLKDPHKKAINTIREERFDKGSNEAQQVARVISKLIRKAPSREAVYMKVYHELVDDPYEDMYWINPHGHF